ADIYKLSPSANGNSFAGRNDQFNNFSLDGSIFNNPFGLDAATPGGQANAQPISLDAIDQIQVSLAPYDVTMSGFTGASVNAVTKSGTNEVKGTVFAFYRNQDLIGKKVRGEQIFTPDLSQIQTGFSVGGPVIKDKLFYFANFELERREDLGSNFLARGSADPADNISRVSSSDLIAVSNILEQRYGYQTGPYQGYTHDTNNEKGLIKFDWNVNQKHNVTLTYNFLNAFRDQNAHPSALGRRGPDATTLQFYNAGYRINNKINSGILEVNSIFNAKFSNKLQVGYTSFNDSRDPFSSPFPVININQNGSRYIVAGHEPFSINNRLSQKVFQVTDNFNYYTGRHTLTLGVSFERFSFDNSFNLGVYEPQGVNYPGGTFGPGFDSVTDFLNFVNAGNLDPIVDYAQNLFSTNNLNDSWALAETNVGQLSFYAQDQWDVNDDLVITFGLRADQPLYFDTSDKIAENIARKGGIFDPNQGEFGGTYSPQLTYFDENGNSIQFDHTKLPSSSILLSPRIGFSYELKGSFNLQVRGGSGIFTGRFPFVWLGNQVANPDFFFYTVTHPDFKFPQVWRSNLGFEKSFNNGFYVVVDGIYTKAINAMMVRNYGLNTPSAALSGADSRLYYTFADRALDPFGTPGQNAYVFTSESKGRSINASIEIRKDWSNGLYTSVAYNYLDAQDISSIEAEISSDAFERNATVDNVNQAMLMPSLYGNKHRFITSINKQFVYGDWKTTISLFGEVAEGGRFSYTYAGDINGDGSALNDLIYVPTTDELLTYQFSGSSVLQDAQRVAFNNFINQDAYLNSLRGQYAERNAALSPWYWNVDLRILQDFQWKDQSFQFSVDILNFSNFLSSNWGVRQVPINTQLLGVSVNPTTREPVYFFDVNRRKTFMDDFSLLSRWQMQLGLRYIF
ncbi:MAG TPA: TonB-dependent receptor, partial [Roseivirga sp.]